MTTKILALAVLLSLATVRGEEVEEAPPAGSRSVLSWATPVASPDGRSIAVGCSDGTVRLVELGTRRQVRSIAEHEKPIRWIAWSTDGALLAVADEDGLVVTVDAATGKRLAAFEVDAGGSEHVIRRLRLFDFQPGGSLLLVRLDPEQATAVRDARTGESILLADVPGIEVDHADWAPDGSLLVCRGPKGVVVLDRELGGVRHGQRELRARLGAIAPDGERLVTSAGGLRLELREIGSTTPTHSMTVTGELLADGFGDFVSSVRFSAQGDRLVTTTSSWATVSCWDVQTGKMLWDVPLGGRPQLSDARFVLGDRCVLVRGFSDRLLDADTGLTLAYPRMRRGAATLDASLEGGVVLVRVNDSLEVWDAKTLEPTFTYVPCADGGWRVDEHPR